VIGVLLLGGFFVGAATYRLPVAVVTAGRPFNALDDIRVRGVPAYRPTGRYLVLSVTVERPTLLGLARGITRHRQLIATNRVSRSDLAEQRALFRESQLVGAAVAARRAGLPAVVRGSGAVVTEVPGHSSAAGVLARDDVIVSDNGRRVGTSLDLMNGNEHVLVVERGAQNVTVTVHGPLSDLATRARQLHVELPFSIQFRKRSLGGPSAGLAYALAIADLLDGPDHTGGRAIAATGELAVDGTLASVGGLPWKAQGARSQHAALLLAPASELALVPKSALTVRGVRGFDDAVAAL
jgi:PDZ domain-containing protein